jgi:hypothetical protein
MYVYTDTTVLHPCPSLFICSEPPITQIDVGAQDAPIRYLRSSAVSWLSISIFEMTTTEASPPASGLAPSSPCG